MAGFNARKYFTVVVVEALLLLSFSEFLKLGSSPAELLGVLLRGEDADFLSDSDGGLLGITSNHDNRNTGSLAILNSDVDFISWRILYSDET